MKKRKEPSAFRRSISIVLWLLVAAIVIGGLLHYDDIWAHAAVRTQDQLELTGRLDTVEMIDDLLSGTADDPNVIRIRLKDSYEFTILRSTVEKILDCEPDCTAEEVEKKFRELLRGKDLVVRSLNEGFVRLHTDALMSISEIKTNSDGIEYETVLVRQEDVMQPYEDGIHGLMRIGYGLAGVCGVILLLGVVMTIFGRKGESRR